ncbi:MAG: transpeptidase family protein [Candidatus Hydrogenedentes bacterium]|nr:transpeptidase family protein [Candidatus Hydrogenedentota bacterium]
MAAPKKSGRHAEERAQKFGGPPQPVNRNRIRWVVYTFAAIFCVISLRLVFLHLRPRAELTNEERVHVGYSEMHRGRGEIFDRNGLLLATEKEVPSLWADTRKVKNAPELAKRLSAAFGLEESKVLALLTEKSKSGDPMKFVWIKRWINAMPLEELEAFVKTLGEGFALKMESSRYYPQGDTAAHVIGFVNRSGDPWEGLELNFDPCLRGVSGFFRARKDGKQRLLESLTLEYTAPAGGDMVQLTLDTAIQHTLEEAIDRRMEECKAVGGMGVVMDPHTGAILALATRPAFNANNYEDYPKSLWKNRALLEMFEPGSAFKIVTAAAALEHGLITPDTMIDCENGRYAPYKRRIIKDVHKLGVEPFRHCFAESSNIAMIKIASQLGEERLDQWIRRFGFGQRTAPDFKHETAGVYRPRNEWSGFSMGSLPMGQEISVTILQLARAFGVIANGGFLVDPYVVERAVSQEGEITYQHDMSHKTRIISPETAATMVDLSYGVVLEGTGDDAAIPEYRVGGKTGTAQIASKTRRGYEEGHYTTVFAGFAPIRDPRLVCVIVIQEPMIKLHFGGYVCGPVFKEVMRDSLIRLNVPLDPMEGYTPPERPAPDAEMDPEDSAPENTLWLANAYEEESAAEGDTAGAMEPVSNELGDVDTVVPPINPKELDSSLEMLMEPLEPLELVAVNEDSTSTQPRLPDLAGMTRQQVQESLRAFGIPLDPLGTGWAVQQFPKPGTPLSHIKICKVQFSTEKAVHEAPEATVTP